VFLQRQPDMSDFDSKVFVEFDRWLQMQVAKTTRKCTIGKLRTIWRAAHSEGLVASNPPDVSQSQCGVPTIKSSGRNVKPVKPFTEAELNAAHAPERPPSTLREFLPRYAAERGIRVRSITSISSRLASLEQMLARPATLDDLNDTTMNLWTSRLLEAGIRPVTVRGYRGAALALWRAAYELHFLETRPGRIRKIRVKPTVPECWTASQLVQVLEAFRKLHGQMQSDLTLRRATFWTAFVLIGYYSALRFGDMLSLRWDQIQDGVIVLQMSKTSDVIACRLPSDALEALDKIRHIDRSLVFGELINSKNLCSLFRRVLRAHDLPGSIKWLRRTSATLLERTYPGAARAHLGHRTHGLAYKHYVDPRLLQQNKPIPPSISQLMAV